MQMLKNKWVIAGIVAVIVMIAAIVYFATLGGNTRDGSDEEVMEEEAIKMSPDEIGLQLEASKDGREVIMTINDTSAFTSFEYEMNYEAEVDGELVSRGAIGSGEVEDEDPIVRNITIGTCSSGTCKYDTGVEEIAFVLRLNLKSGETAIVEEQLSLE